MTPGLARGPPFPTSARKGSVVAIASLERPSVPLVVGVCEIDVAGLQEVVGAKGHAVRGKHWEGDEIWAWGQGGSSGRRAPESLEEWDSNNGMKELGEQFGKAIVDDSEDDQGEGGVSVDLAASEHEKPPRRNDFVEGEDGGPYEEVTIEEKQFSTKGKTSCQHLQNVCPAKADIRDRRHLLECFPVWSPPGSQQQSIRSTTRA